MTNLLNSLRSSAVCSSDAPDMLVNSDRWPRRFWRGLPLPLLPSSFPSTHSFSNPSSLITCPKNCSCLLRSISALPRGLSSFSCRTAFPLLQSGDSWSYSRQETRSCHTSHNVTVQYIRQHYFSITGYPPRNPK